MSRLRRPAGRLALVAMAMAVALASASGSTASPRIPEVPQRPAPPPVPASEDAAADGAEQLVEIKLLATNDIHGQLHPPVVGYGGAAHLAAHLERIERAHPDAIHVDSGDATGGNGGLSGRFGGEPTIEVLNAMGLDVQALGNHEFDAGTAELRRRYDGGCWRDDCGYRDGQRFPGADWRALAGNVSEHGEEQSLFPGTWTTEVAGVSVGFVGVTTTDLITRVGNPDLDFVPWWVAIDELAGDLEERGVEVVVVLRHVGSRQLGGANDCTGWWGAAADYNRRHIPPSVDVVVDAHTHEAYVCDEPGVPLTTQALHRTLMFTEIDLVFDRDRGEVVDRSATNRWVTHDVEPDPEVAGIIERYEGWR